MQIIPWPKPYTIFLNFYGGAVFASQITKRRKRMCMADQLPCGSVPTPAISCTKIQNPFSSCRQSHGQINLLLLCGFFEGGPVLASQINELRKRMCMAEQLPCGSVLTPGISCTKIKIHWAVADNPMAKLIYFYSVLFFFQGGPVFALHTKKLRKRMCLVNQLPYVSEITPAISCTKFKIHSAHGDSPMAKTFCYKVWSGIY